MDDCSPDCSPRRHTVSQERNNWGGGGVQSGYIKRFCFSEVCGIELDDFLYSMDAVNMFLMPTLACLMTTQSVVSCSLNPFLAGRHPCFYYYYYYYYYYYVRSGYWIQCFFYMVLLHICFVTLVFVLCICTVLCCALVLALLLALVLLILHVN
jgi:hypothetical protein